MSKKKDDSHCHTPLFCQFHLLVFHFFTNAKVLPFIGRLLAYSSYEMPTEKVLIPPITRLYLITPSSPATICILKVQVPGINFRKVSSANPGEILDYLGANSGGTWYQVGAKSWVLAELVTKPACRR